jgi:hypothetical protein
LKIRQFGHGLNRLDQGPSDDPRTVEQAFGVQGLGTRVIDDQHFIRFVLGDAGQDFDFLQQARSFEGAGEELLTTGAHRGQAGRGIGFVQAEEQQRQAMIETFLGFGSQFQANAGATEVHIHDNGCRQALDHRGAERRHAIQGLGAEPEEFQLLGQALGTVVILQHHVDRFAQGRQERLVELIAMAQASARQALHQAVEIGDQTAAQASAIGVDSLQRLADMTCQLDVLRLFETFGEPQQAQVGFTQFRQIVGGPLAALQALPYLKYLTCLMNDPLGKVMLEALAAGIFWLGHILTTS